MSNQKKILIILDSKKYIEKEDSLKKELSKLCDPYFYFTDYENRLIKFFHGISGIGNFLSHISYWMISFTAAVFLFVSKRNQYESKIFINPIVGVFYCFLLAVFNKNDKVSVAGFLFVDKKNKLYLAMRENFVKFSYKKASKIIVYSKSEIDFYSDRFPSLASKFKFVKYGRDYDIFADRKYESDTQYIASGGVSNRDFNTLACALSILEAKQFVLKCKIATRPETYSLLCNPSNLEILHNVRIETFGSFLAQSLLVIIPLKNTSLSAGHMALLEAMYLGKIIIVSDIPAVRDYVDERMVFFYKANDANNLADVIEYTFQNNLDKIILEKAKLAQQTYYSTYCFSSFLNRIVIEATLDSLDIKLNLGELDLWVH